MLVALILANVVRDVLPLTEDQIELAGGIYDIVLDVSQMTIPPTAGWTFNGSGVVPPGMQITRLAMRQRLTVTELLGIMTYVVNNPASIVAMLMQNLQVATFIDLSRSDTIAGMTLLSQAPFSLITPQRATAILTTPPSPLEVYIP